MLVLTLQTLKLSSLRELAARLVKLSVKKRAHKAKNQFLNVIYSHWSRIT